MPCCDGPAVVCELLLVQDSLVPRASGYRSGAGMSANRCPETGLRSTARWHSVGFASGPSRSRRQAAPHALEASEIGVEGNDLGVVLERERGEMGVVDQVARRARLAQRPAQQIQVPPQPS